MELFISIAVFLLLALPAVLSAKKLSELKSETESLRLKLQEREEKEAGEEGDESFEEAYRRGLAGIMAYSLTQAAGEDSYD